MSATVDILLNLCDCSPSHPQSVTHHHHHSTPQLTHLNNKHRCLYSHTPLTPRSIYFAAKSGRMAAEAIVEASARGTKMCGEAAIRTYLDKWDRKYWTTYKVLDILQKVFYRSNPAREAFVEMCEDSYVQKMTFDSYLYKTVVPGACWWRRSCVASGHMMMRRR